MASNAEMELEKSIHETEEMEHDLEQHLEKLKKSENDLHIPDALAWNFNSNGTPADESQDAAQED